MNCKTNQSFSVISLCLLILIFGCSGGHPEKDHSTVLPYYQEATFTPSWFESEGDVPIDFHKIAPFKLTDQSGKLITNETLQGKIYVANFFFASCPGICPKMTSNMQLVQSSFQDNNEVLILSHSVTPEYDSVSVLREYGQINNINPDKWHLLTGDRAHIYHLGRSEYFIEEDMGESKDPGDFIHTENFVLIDHNMRIRGIYNGLNKASVSQLVQDIQTLLETEV